MRTTLLYLALFFTIQSFACSCPQLSVEKSYQYASDVFIGTVISVDSTMYSSRGHRVFTATIKIKRPFKQKLHNSFLMRTFYASSEGSCDFWLYNIGKDYLIYTSRQSGILSAASICLRTAAIENVTDNEIVTLQELYTKQEADNEPPVEIISFVTDKELSQFIKQENDIERLQMVQTILIVTAVFFLAVLLYLTFRIVKLKRNSHSQNIN